MESLRSKFEAARHLEEASSAEFHQTLYNVGWHFLNRGNAVAGLSLIEWTADTDENAVRGMFHTGRAHLIHGRSDTALEKLEAALEQAPDNERLRRNVEAARAYRRNPS